MKKLTSIVVIIFFFFFGIIAGINVCCTPAYAQGFLIKPLRIECSTQPGEFVRRVIKLYNTTAQTLTIGLKLAELSQNESGVWQAIEADSNIDISGLSSCLKWTKLSVQKVKIEPLQTAEVEINLQVPRGTRGFYGAALLAELKRPKPKEGKVRIALTIRFLVPILVEIQGRPAVFRIRLENLNMCFFEKSKRNPATTLVSMSIINKGETYSRLKGRVDILHQVGEAWHRITQIKFSEVGIIPGVRLNLKNSIKRQLPSGKYKLRGILYVDGRQIKSLIKEINFAGDPNITKVATDVPLALDPSIVSIKAVPGGTRAGIIKVRNLSDEAVNVSVDVTVPFPLQNVALGQLKGEDLSCAGWTEVAPDNFTLRAGREQNILITTKLPKREKMYANYYAALNFHAAYADGQSAGENTSLIWLKNKKIKAKPAAQIIKVGLITEENSRYVIQVKFSNIGDVHFSPKCKATVTRADGTSVLENTLTGEREVMLPLETRDFSGILDLSRVEEGIYGLTVWMDYGEKTVNKTLLIWVFVKEGEKKITLYSD